MLEQVNQMVIVFSIGSRNDKIHNGRRLLKQIVVTSNFYLVYALYFNHLSYDDCEEFNKYVKKNNIN